MAEITLAGALEGVDARLAREVGILAGRLAQLLERLPVRDEPAIEGQSFLWAMYDAIGNGRPLSDWEGGVRLPSRPPHPLDSLVDGLGLSPVEVDVVLLAGLADEHEGLSALLRVLHPTGEPRPTTGLAAQLFFRHRDERDRFRTHLPLHP